VYRFHQVPIGMILACRRKLKRESSRSVLFRAMTRPSLTVLQTQGFTVSITSRSAPS
jgi:hypothetical protein